MKKLLFVLLVPLILLTTACSHRPPEPPEPPCDIKGNISSSGEKIYHVPGGQFYDVTDIDESNGEEWFCTEEAAKDAGWRESKR